MTQAYIGMAIFGALVMAGYPVLERWAARQDGTRPRPICWVLPILIAMLLAIAATAYILGS